MEVVGLVRLEHLKTLPYFALYYALGAVTWRLSSRMQSSSMSNRSPTITSITLWPCLRLALEHSDHDVVCCTPSPNPFGEANGRAHLENLLTKIKPPKFIVPSSSCSRAHVRQHRAFKPASRDLAADLAIVFTSVPIPACLPACGENSICL
jgi:hypothetical protein